MYFILSILCLPREGGYFAHSTRSKECGCEDLDGCSEEQQALVCAQPHFLGKQSIIL